MSAELDLIKSAVSGDRNSQYKLAKMYRDGVSVDADANKAIKWFTSSAEQGHIRAKYELARILETDGTEKDREKIIPLLEDAAAAGENDAALYLTKKYRSGENVELDNVITGLRKCSDNGSKRCKLELALILCKSELREDLLESIKLCYELAMEGDKDAMFRLYLDYRYAVGTKMNKEIAGLWLRKAAEAGHNGAKKELESLE